MIPQDFAMNATSGSTRCHNALTGVSVLKPYAAVIRRCRSPAAASLLWLICTRVEPEDCSDSLPFHVFCGRTAQK